MKPKWWESMKLEAPAEGDNTSHGVPMVPIGTFDTSGISHLADKTTISRRLADTLVANFNAQVMKTQPFFDDGGHREDKATGWITRLYVGTFPHAVTGDPITGLLADVEWTSLGLTMLGDKQYRYTSVVIAPYRDEEDGKDYTVLRSATLTNKPVMKMMPAIALAGGTDLPIISDYVLIGTGLASQHEFAIALSELGAPTEEGAPVRKVKVVSLGDVAAKIAEENAEDESRTAMWAAMSAFQRLVHEAIEGDTEEGVEPLVGPVLSARLKELADEFATLAADAVAIIAPAPEPGPMVAPAALSTPGLAPVSDITPGKEGQNMKQLVKLADGTEVEVDLTDMPEIVALEGRAATAEARLAEIEGEKRTARVEAIRKAAVEKGLSEPSIARLVKMAESTDTSAIVLAEGATPTDLLGAVEELVTELEVVPVQDPAGGHQDPPSDEITLSETELEIGKKMHVSPERQLAAKKAILEARKEG